MSKADRERAEQGLIFRNGKLVSKTRCACCGNFATIGQKLCAECARVVRVVSWMRQMQVRQQAMSSGLLIPKPGMSQEAIREAVGKGRG